MNQAQRTPAERRERSAEEALFLAIVAIAATEAYKSLARRRWRRGKSMDGPAKVYVALWTASSVAWFLRILWVGSPPVVSRDSALVILWIALGGWAGMGLLTWVAWIVALALGEAVAWLGHTDPELATNRIGHWLNLDECRTNKARIEAGLVGFAPNLGMSGLLAAAGDGGALLGFDLAAMYSNYAKPWIDWNNAEARLRAGQGVWYDNPPPEDQTISVVGPYIVCVLLAGAIALWIGCLLDLPGRDPLTATVFFGSAVVVMLRHRLRSAIIALR